jgi:hypothetical protein
MADAFLQPSAADKRDALRATETAERLGFCLAWTWSSLPQNTKSGRT